MSKCAFSFLLQRSELEMYVSVAKCISEMADAEIDRIVQLSKVMIVSSWSFITKLHEMSIYYYFSSYQSVLAAEEHSLFSVSCI